MTLFPKPTFNSITSGLRKTISKLDALLKTNADQVVVLHEKVAAHYDNMKALETEGAQAKHTAAKLRELVGE